MKSRCRPWLAALFSIIPGAGQLYCGELRRGLALLFGLPAQALIFLGMVEARPILPLLVVVWLWNLFDAWRIAKGGRPSIAVPVFLIIALNLAAGWRVTQIDLIELAGGVQQMKDIGSSLARPVLFERKTEQTTASAKFIVPGPGAPSGWGGISNPSPSDLKPGISLHPVTAEPGERITVTGWAFPPEQRGRIHYFIGTERLGPRFTTDSNGRFSVSFTNVAKTPGDYFVEARVDKILPGWRPTETLRLTSKLMLETIFLALMGTAFSIIVTVPLSFLGARNLMKGSRGGRAIYSATRGMFNVLRSIEVLIIAVMLSKAVGIGPFAGVLALAIHGVGALGKLYSEAIESIDSGPIEAITATGASRLQVIIYAVVPQVIPQFISFTMYRWDINVRMATVIGLVGGGGIGYILLQYIGLLQWREAATAIWLIAAVVMLMDYASAVIREKLV